MLPDGNKISLPSIGSLMTQQHKPSISELFCEAENSAAELLKKITELKGHQKPSKIDMVWFAHHLSNVNTSYQQIEHSLSMSEREQREREQREREQREQREKEQREIEQREEEQREREQREQREKEQREREQSEQRKMYTGYSLNEVPMSNLVQASIEATKLPVCSVPKATREVKKPKPAISLENILVFNPVKSSSSLTPAQVSCFTTFSPSISNTINLQTPTSPPSSQLNDYVACSPNSMKKRKMEEPFSHQPHKRAYKHSTPNSSDRRCTSCNTSVTPEWRRGPLGPKSLCNACGLQFAKNGSTTKTK